MKFFRNPEIKRICILYVVLAIIFTGIAALFDCAFFVLVICVVYIAVSLIMTYRRYQTIENLAASIDLLLHGKQKIYFDEYREGELSVLEDELSKMTNRLLEQAEQLQRDKEYLSDAMADISHQLRSPLTSSQLILSLLKDPDLTALRRRQLLMEQEQLLSHMGWLVESMLKMSKMDAGTAYLKKETVYVKDLLQKALEPVLISMELRGVHCIQTGVTDEAAFTGDLAWCSEAILNIVKNCMEHTTDGRKAEITDGSETLQDRRDTSTGSGTIEITCEDTPLYLQLTIEDDGEGFAPEDLPHIFERFYKGKNASGQSVGIGLALARMIIVEMNGTIKAENRLQGGARFTICFYRQETV